MLGTSQWYVEEQGLLIFGASTRPYLQACGLRHQGWRGSRSQPQKGRRQGGVHCGTAPSPQQLGLQLRQDVAAISRFYMTGEYFFNSRSSHFKNY